MARYEIKVNRPGQVEVGADDGTVTIYTGHADEHDEFVLDFGDDSNAMDVIRSLTEARLALAVAAQHGMEEHYDRRCSDCGQIVGHAPGCLHLDLIETRVRKVNVATRSIIRDVFSVPQSRRTEKPDYTIDGVGGSW